MSKRNETHRSFSLSPHAPRDQEEQEPLLAEGEQAREDGVSSACHPSDQPCPPNPHATLPVYNTIHQVRRDMIASIDDPYSLDQLRSPRMNISIVRPLVDKYHDMYDISVVYCLLVNRTQFLREQSYQVHHQTVNFTRALLCELVATRIIRRFDDDNKGPEGLLFLANVLVAGFEPFQGAPGDIVQENGHARHWVLQKRGGYERMLTALEVAIISQSKIFLSSPACQKVVDAIYKGKVTYTPSSFIDILPDHYKHKPILLYNPREAALLNQYRLIVPRTRNLLEVCQFIVLLVLYMHVMENFDPAKFTIRELVFCIYTFGWVLDQFASILEHGWQVYTQNLWSFLDVAFIGIYTLYFAFRVIGVASGKVWPSQQALDILSTGAPVLIPRLAFNLMSENMLFVSLRSMMADFALLTVLAVWCFAGFLLSMKWLNNGVHQTITISKWMLWVWFGLDGTGIQKSVDFHWLLGPILMVAFAILGNTLFLTILVSMLSNTFANIVSNATAEIQYRRAVLTFEGVKSDAIFSYQPPFNILALCILLPLKFAVTPRWFHKINVTAIRVINLPLLLIIAFWERSSFWETLKQRFFGSDKSRPRLAFWGFSRFSVHGGIQAVFDVEPPQSLLIEISDADNNNINSNVIHEEHPATFNNKHLGVHPNAHNQGHKPRKDSIEPFAGLAEHIPDILHHLGMGSDMKERLEALEESTKRIEDMLGKLCENLINDDTSDEGAESGV